MKSFTIGPIKAAIVGRPKRATGPGWAAGAVVLGYGQLLGREVPVVNVASGQPIPGVPEAEYPWLSPGICMTRP
jgi:hypothetical protein